MAFNLTALLNGIAAIPYVVIGIQQIHGDAVAGETKQQLALEALGLATGVAGVVVPGEATNINASAQLAANLINSFVSAFKTTSSFGFTPSTPPTPQVAPAQGAAVAGK